MNRTLAPWVLSSALAASACTGQIGVAGDAPDPAIPPTLPTAEACADVTPLLHLPMRRLSPDEYRSTVRDLVGRDVDDLAVPAASAVPEGLLRNDPAIGVSSSLAEAYLNDAERIALALVEPTAAERFAPCMTSEPDRACAEQFLSAVAERAFRRPLKEGELDRFMATYDREQAAGVTEGLVWALQRIAFAPDFLYKPELGQPTGNDPSVRRLAGHEVASRLSYALVGKPPTAELREAAKSTDFADPQERLAWADKLLFDTDGKPTAAARAHLGTFFDDWLQIDHVSVTADAAVQEHWREETRAFADEVVWERRQGVGALLDGGFAMVDASLAEHYGMDGVSGDALQPVESDLRRGVLQQALFLNRTWGGATAAIHRGVEVLERFWCAEDRLGAPPPEAADFQPAQTGTLRERLAETEMNSACSSCHGVINPIGYVFDEFGEFGEHREVDDLGHPIDTTARIAWLDDAPVADSAELSARLAQEPAVLACGTNWLLRHTTGRTLGLENTDEACLLQQISPDASTVEQLMTFVASDAFIHNRDSETNPSSQGADQ